MQTADRAYSFIFSREQPRKPSTSQIQDEHRSISPPSRYSQFLMALIFPPSCARNLFLRCRLHSFPASQRSPLALVLSCLVSLARLPVNPLFPLLYFNHISFIHLRGNSLTRCCSSKLVVFGYPKWSLACCAAISALSRSTFYTAPALHSGPPQNNTQQ